MTQDGRPPQVSAGFAGRITRAPEPFEPERGDEAVAALPEIGGPVRDLLRGTAGCSPYLRGLMTREAGWLPGALDEPETARDAVLAALPEVAPDQVPVALRAAKRRLALLVALADLGGVWTLEEVTATLSRLADIAADTAIKAALWPDLKRGKLPGQGEGDLAEAGGFVALAMGKQGANELNYSSDIDLICLFDDERYHPVDLHEARSVLIRATRRMARTLSDVTADGYVFRTDLRLRPDPAVTPVCLSMEAAERYYESVGRTWERAAFIKARPCAGDLAAGDRFLEALRPFVWRKHLDFAAIEDAHAMRVAIRDHKGLGGKLTLEGHNVKLGRGGIREIEFFAQTRQLISGGRDPALRPPGTVAALEAFRETGWVPPDVADTLVGHYRAHREVEHRLQMIGDAQTHALPTSAEGFARLAAFMGRDVAGLRAELRDRFEEVHGLTEDFFAPDPVAPMEVEFGREVTERWPGYPALRTTRAVEIFNRLRPDILARLQEAAKPEEALAQFDAFLAGLPAGVQLFSLFEASPDLRRLIVDICATAPALAQYLSRNAGVLDAVIGGDFFAPWPGVAGLVEALGAALAGEADYEARLDAARRWAKEWHFRIGVHHLRGLIEAETAGRHYADLAEAVVAGLWPVVCENFAARHGAPPGVGSAVVAMGSLGAGRLNATSDLDLIVIYDEAGVESSDGPRPLPSRTYYARLTQALVTALSARMAEGRLYEVDMRLRPSGRKGPVATSLTSFGRYQREEAWTWEHLALTRARPVAGPEALREAIETERRDVLAEKAEGETVLEDVAAMRARIAEAKSPDGVFDAKIGPGRLQDMELLAQTAALRAGSPVRDFAGQLESGIASGWLTEDEAETLRSSAGLFWSLQAAARLLTGAPLDLEAVGEGGLRLILRETGMESAEALIEELECRGEAAAAVIAAKLEGAG